jgi:hypothetical protein
METKFSTYSPDGYDSKEAERDVCIYSEEYFKHTLTTFLKGLRYTPTENISDWIKRKEKYEAAIKMPKTFDKLLKENNIFKFNFLFALDPVNINKETSMLHRSAHIFCETIRSNIRKSLHKLFYNEEAMRTHFICKNFLDQTKHEIGLIDALGLMFSVRRDIANLAAEIDEKNGLSATYTHKEGQHIMDNMIRHKIPLFKGAFVERAKEVDINVRKIVAKARFENLIAYYNTL